MKLRWPCEHDHYEAHGDARNPSQPICPGGVFLPADTLVIEKVDGEWPSRALQNLSDPPLYELSSKDLALLEAGGRLSLPVKPRYILDALTIREAE